MLTIRDVEEVFEQHPWLRPPRNVIIIKEPVEMVEGYRKILFAGLTPSWKRDTIILSSLATPETVVHETIHTYGLGETAAWTLAPKLRQFRQAFPPLLKRRVKYRRCNYCEEFKTLHTKYADRAEHWVLET